MSLKRGRRLQQGPAIFFANTYLTIMDIEAFGRSGYEYVDQTYTASDAIVSSFQAGYRYVIQYQVGYGGGHRLYTNTPYLYVTTGDGGWTCMAGWPAMCGSSGAWVPAVSRAPRSRRRRCSWKAASGTC